MITKDFFKFSILSYLDKGLTFLIPLMIPFFFKDQISVYNEFEYVYAIAIFTSVIIDLGLKSYSFYGYKVAENKEQFLEDIKGIYILLLRVIALLSLTILIVHYFYNIYISTELFFFIIVRSTFLFLSYFLSVYYRLLDKPSKMFYLTLPVNIIPVLILLGIFVSGLELKIEYLFIGQILMLLFSLVFFKIEKSFVFKKITIIRDALKFSGPIFISLVIANIVASYAKVYTYDYLSEFEMYQLSLNQRVALLIFLLHTTFINFYTKKIYLSQSKSQDVQLIFNYLKLIFASLFLVVGALYSFDVFINPYKESIINLSTIYIIIYTLFWVVGSYFEAFISRVNKTKQIPIIGIFSGMVYLLVLLNMNKDVEGLTLAMAFYSMTYFVTSLTIVKINSIKRIK